MRLFKILFGLILFIIGVCLLYYYTCWQAALGVFLLFWSHNIEQQIQ